MVHAVMRRPPVWSVTAAGDQVSVSGGVHNDLIKRVLRDIHRTGQDPQQAIQQITETVYPMYKVGVAPSVAYS
jgi:uridine kinase